jgi:uncharacterized membrane protein YgcG
MKKLVAGVFGLAVLAVIIGIGGISFPKSGSSGETSTITDYSADFTVNPDGDLDVVETLTVNFPISRHGIFRFFDTRDNPNGSHSRVIPEDVEVTRDGQSEEYDRETKRRGRYVDLKIGRADTLLSGSHVYRIDYTIPGALSKGADGTRTQFYWDLIPSGWEMPITQSHLTVHLPAPAQGFRCAVGVHATSGCTADGEGTDTLTVLTGTLSPNTPVTIKAGLDIATPSAHALPWNGGLDPILGRHPVVLGGVLAIALLAALSGLVLSRSTHEKQPAFPLMYAPPEGVGPAQAAYILDEKVDDKAFVATMMYAAEKGAVQLSQDGKKWTITGAGDESVWDRTDGVTRSAGESLGVRQPGASFTASPKSVSSGQKLHSVLKSFRSNTKGWATSSGMMEMTGLGGFGCFVLLAVWGLTIWLGAFNPLNMSAIGLIPGAFAVFGLGVGTRGAGTKRTPAGRDLWSRAGGFRRILSTPSAVDRFDFSGRKELYTAYLPWAVAFDCADEWAKKYRIETGEEPPVPVYFAGYTGDHTSNYVNQMVNSFDSAVSSAISSYEATQSSSSSGGGGGGFSGGGGGGGGGGGSW